ncbi:MAG TPA: TIGR03016 family PEP-CTERM system-associated outer membrane protein [Telluria sp.]|nr:TIGR03016 family PEP-CTERM system-associated outer membrane protein [Telluria sp.]
MAKRHRGTPQTTSPSLPLAAPVAVLALLLAPAAHAQWKVVPGVDLRETYSDNVQLEAADRAHGQFITELAPSLALANDSPRLKVHANAISHLYAYSDRVDGTNSSSSELRGDAHARLIGDLLFVDGAASIGQQAVSAFGPQVDNNNGYSSANRAKVSTWRVSPYLRHRFGATASGELRYTRDSVKSGNSLLGDSTSNTLAASLSSGPAFHAIGWDLQASRQDLADSLDRKFHIQNSNATLRYRATQNLSPTASVGYDQYDYPKPGGSSAGRSYSLGFVWTPSLRTSIQATAGHRYFGPSYLLALSHRSRGTVWTINYNDAVTTTRDQLLIPAAVNAVDVLDRLFATSIPDAVARRQAVDAYIAANGLPPSLAHNINYFSNRFVLQRAFQAAVAFNTARTTSVVALNASKRNALSAPDAVVPLPGTVVTTLDDDTKQAGASVSMSYRLSPRTATSLNLNASRSESLTTGIVDNRRAASLSMDAQLQRKLKGAVQLRHTQGNIAIAGGRTYRENAVSASLSYQL